MFDLRGTGGAGDSPNDALRLLVVAPPLPIGVLLGFAALLVIDVLAMRLVLPLDVVGLLAGRPRIDLTVWGAATGKERKHQY